jgi:hypothetical protein
MKLRGVAILFAWVFAAFAFIGLADLLLMQLGLWAGRH